MTQDLPPIEKIRLLTAKHELGCLFDPGGAVFTNSEKRISIRIPAYDDQEDYETLLNGLVALGLEEPLQSSDP
jgi:hypothetical protein